MNRNEVLNSIWFGNFPNLFDTFDAWPEMEALSKTPQDPEWHAEGDVLTHTGMVLEASKKINETVHESERSAIRLACLFHDIAKPETTRYDEEIKHTIAPGHERIGGIRTRYLLHEFDTFKIHSQYDSSYDDLRREISQLVATHHLVKRTVKKFEANDPDAVPFLERLASRVNTRLLWALEMADMTGRKCVDQVRQIEIVQLFRMLCEEHNVFGNKPVPWHNVQDYWNITSSTNVKFNNFEVARYAISESHRRRLTGEIKTKYQADAFIHEIAKTKKQIPEVIITVGVSGSGKSTGPIRRLTDNYQIISPDAQRLAEYGNEEHQKDNGPIYQACAELLKNVLRRSGKVYYDATNLVPDLRSKIVSLCHNYGAYVDFWVWDVSIEEVLRRNSLRKRQVPEEIIRRQISKFEWPFPEEYHSLKVLD